MIPLDNNSREEEEEDIELNIQNSDRITKEKDNVIIKQNEINF